MALGNIFGDLQRVLTRIGHPSVQEIRAACVLHPPFVDMRGKTYQSIYYQLNKLVNSNLVNRLEEEGTAGIRYSLRDGETLMNPTRIRPLAKKGICKICGKPTVTYRGKHLRITTQGTCPSCGSPGHELQIIHDPIRPLGYIVSEMAMVGTLDWGVVRMPQTIEGYGTEYRRASELLRHLTGRRLLIGVVGDPY